MHLLPHARTTRWALALLLVVCGELFASGVAATAITAAAGEASGGKRYFGFRIESRDFTPAVRRRSLLRNAAMPLHGAVKDYGYFYATLYLGTPAKKFAVIVDTGSTMTYVPCSTCGSGCGPNHQDAAFDPEASETSSYISCTSPKCNCGSPRCGCSAKQCTYTRSYAEQSSSSGFLLQDVLSLHDGLPGAPIIFGCETRETGEIYKQRADGLFGLGNSDASVVNQLVKAGLIDDVFSLCFGMVEGDGALLLGDAEVPGTIMLQYTPLLTSASHPFYYNVKMLSLMVDGQLLPVSQSLFDQGYGTVLDSGTTFTYMPTPVFQAFAGAVEAFAIAHGLQRVPGPDPQYEDICFGQAPSHEDLEGLSAVFPSMEIQFDQGTSLVLGPLNYLFVHTFNSGKYCLGVFDNGRAGTLLGGITFRNVLVRYDRAKKQVGFGPAPCKELGEMQRPPCSMFATEGASELTAAAAAADGDCSMEPLRQQQQEMFELEDDLLEQALRQQQAAAEQQAAEQAAAEQAAAEAAEQAAKAEAAAKAAKSQGGKADAATVEQQHEQPDHGSHRPAPTDPQHKQVPGSSGAASGSSGKGSMTSVAIGLLVAVVAVLSLGFAVALLQPATRDRIRAAFGGSRQYRSLDEDTDPEGGFTPTLSGGGGGGENSLNPGAVELSGMGCIELKSESTPLGATRGLTTPQKLQRSVSNTSNGEDAGGSAAGALGTTPRGGAPQSPLR